MMVVTLLVLTKSLIKELSHRHFSDRSRSNLTENNFAGNFLVMFQLTYLAVSTFQSPGSILFRQFTGKGKTVFLIKLEPIFKENTWMNFLIIYQYQFLVSSLANIWKGISYFIRKIISDVVLSHPRLQLFFLILEEGVSLMIFLLLIHIFCSSRNK